MKLIVSALAVISTTTNLAAAATTGQESERISVDDPRPLFAVAKLLEQRCGCAITYEDPKWSADDVVDISGTIWHREDIRPRVPKGGRFSFALPATFRGLAPGERQRILDQIVAQYQEGDVGPGLFRTVSEGAATHIIPLKGSILDQRITNVATAQPLGAVVKSLMTQVSNMNGVRIALGVVPINGFKKNVTVSARNEPAREVLARALTNLPGKPSWVLLYDVARQTYYLSVHYVR